MIFKKLKMFVPVNALVDNRVIHRTDIPHEKVIRVYKNCSRLDFFHDDITICGVIKNLNSCIIKIGAVQEQC